MLSRVYCIEHVNRYLTNWTSVYVFLFNVYLKFSQKKLGFFQYHYFIYFLLLVVGIVKEALFFCFE